MADLQELTAGSASHSATAEPESPAKPASANAEQKQETKPKKEGEMTNADRKQAQKAAKAARRALAKSQSHAPTPGATPGATPGPSSPSSKAPSDYVSVHSGDVTNLPHRNDRKPSTGTGNKKSATEKATTENTAPKKKKKQQMPKERRIDFFSHLYDTNPLLESLVSDTSREVNPTILTTALQIRNFNICGSHARGVALLLALRAVVQSYTSPQNATLPRHLAAHALTVQLSVMKGTGRAFSASQSNSVRWLKNVVAKMDPDAPEEASKANIIKAIDEYIAERFTAAAAAIASSAAERIQDGDVVLVYGKSYVVQQALITACRDRGRHFRVVVVDGRPLFEGRNLARALQRYSPARGYSGKGSIRVSYTLTSSLAVAARGASKCLLGASGVLSNGAIYSRVGTALVAMMAQAAGVNVVVCAESVKFTEGVALDSIVTNELGPETDMLPLARSGPFDHLEGSEDEPSNSGNSNNKNNSKDQSAKNAEDRSSSASERNVTPADYEMATSAAETSLQHQLRRMLDDTGSNRSRQAANLHLLNVLYDTTPASCVDAIVTELGTIPPSAVPAIQRLTAVEGEGAL